MEAAAGCWRFQPRQPSRRLPEWFVVRFDTAARPPSTAPAFPPRRGELNLDLDLSLAHQNANANWALAQRRRRIVAFWEGYSSGFTELRLTVRGDSLSGWAYYTGDMGGVTRIAVVAVRVTCPVASSVVAIRGRVVDSRSAKPLIGASVMISSPPAGVTTNADGVFELQVPRPDRSDVVLVGSDVVLVVRGSGYRTKRIQVPITPFDSLLNVGDIDVWR